MFTGAAAPAAATGGADGAEAETQEYRAVVGAPGPVPGEPTEVLDGEVEEFVEPEESLEPEGEPEAENEVFEDELEPVEEEYDAWVEADEDLEDELEEFEEPGEPDPGEPPVEDTAADERGTQRGEDLKVWLGEFRGRAAGIWRDWLKRIGDIRIPNFELDGQKVLVVSGVVLLLLLVGAAGYVIGKGSGDDVDAARLEGELRGKQAGAVAGATKGYAAGFKKGRDTAFDKAYRASYIRNYRRAYEKAGMEPPKPGQIEVPEP